MLNRHRPGLRQETLAKVLKTKLSLLERGPSEKSQSGRVRGQLRAKSEHQTRREEKKTGELKAQAAMVVSLLLENARRRRKSRKNTRMKRWVGQAGNLKEGKGSLQPDKEENLLEAPARSERLNARDRPGDRKGREGVSPDSEKTATTGKTTSASSTTRRSKTTISESRDATTILRETGRAADSGTTRSTRAATKRAGEKSTIRPEVQTSEPKQDTIRRREAGPVEAIPQAPREDLQSTTAATTERGG